MQNLLFHQLLKIFQNKHNIKLIKGEITAQKNGAEDLLSVYVPGAAIKDFFLGGNYKLKLSGATNDSKLTVNEGWVSIQRYF